MRVRRFFGLCLLALTLGIAYHFYTPAPTVDKTKSLQRSAAHMITTYDKEDARDGVCSSTAVGPHVLLTAEHCWDDKEDVYIHVDLNREQRKVISVVKDHQEHILMFVDGPEFTKYINLLTSVRTVKPGEKVYLYGDGGADYPPRRLDGSQIKDFDSNSEVDQAIGIQQFSMPVIPGDSGSAIYGQDGKIVALVTYSHHETTVGFSLAFDPLILMITTVGFEDDIF